MKLYLTPSPEQANTNNGIGQIIRAQHKYLPEFGIELVDSLDKADLTACHVQGVNLPEVGVQHIAGLEWDGDGISGYTLQHSAVNRAIIDTAKRATFVTVPSAWVAMPFQRDMRFTPKVIGHGIELDEWKPLPENERKGYILWNKNRIDVSCPVEPALQLARRKLPVVSTFGDSSIMQVIGLVSFEQMREYVKRASIYLATTKETFGIGTLEAMAAGVPVLGYRHGGTADLIEHKVTGYLVEPGDIAGLVEGYAWIMVNWQAVSQACIQKAQSYSWESIIGKYAELYKAALIEKNRAKTTAIIITNYNYEKYLKDSIESAINQTERCEVVVVDDCSTDNSASILDHYEKAGYIKVIHQPKNLGVAFARNAGIASVKLDYIICLDADDWLHPEYVATLKPHFDRDKSLGIGYSGLMMHFENGDSALSNFPPEYNFENMIIVSNPPSNCVPSAAMFRRDMWLRSGGYRQEHAPAEDAEFWVRGASIGFYGKRVTQEPMFNYRLHGGSHSRVKQYKPIDRWHPFMRDKIYPIGAPTLNQALVHSYSKPVISVIIPVGKGHIKYLPEAINSVVAQSFREWEVLVINDSGEKVDLPEYPFIQLYQTKKKTSGAAIARQIGLENAKGNLVLYLDADDILHPDALLKMLRLYAKAGGRYVYTDWVASDTNQIIACLDYSPELVVEKRGIHAVTVLMARDEALRVGWDKSKDLPAWEDNDYFIRCAIAGVQGVRLPETLFTYRIESSTRRIKAVNQPLGDKLLIELDKYKGETMASCCGGNANQNTAYAEWAQSIYGKQAAQAQGAESGQIQMLYTGINIAAVTYTINGHPYVVGDNDNERYVWAYPQDVDKLLQLGKFQLA